MTNYSNLINMLETANENDANVEINYASNDDNVNVAMEVIPDILIQDNWISIFDKEKGERFYFSFMLDANIEFDEAEEEYIIPIGNGELIIAAR